MDEKIKVDLCGNHFQRLVEDDTCVSCPSRIENEGAVRALAALHESSEDDKLRAIISELQSIRKTQSAFMKKLQSLDHKVTGNGRPGLADRLLIMETKLNTNEKGRGVVIAIITSGISTLVAVAGLLLK